MWSAVWRLELRKTIPWYLGVLALWVVYILFAPGALGSASLAGLGLGALLGIVLAGRIFEDPAGTQPFTFSLPVSRSRLFLCRWALGLILQAGALLVLAALLAGGVRQAVQVGALDSPWYPMVRYYELTVLWPFALASLLAYQGVLFGVVLRRLSRQRAALRARRQLLGTTWLTVELVVVMPLAVAAWLAWDLDLRHAVAGGAWRWPGCAYVALVVLLTTVAARHCYERVEVES
jgi:hypothetical protein